MYFYFTPREFLLHELDQMTQEGFDPFLLHQLLDRVSEKTSWQETRGIYRKIMDNRVFTDNYPYVEPSDWELISRNFPDSPTRAPSSGNGRDALAGALWGRIIGCMMGKPVEGWSRKKILELLDAPPPEQEYPFPGYIPQYYEVSGTGAELTFRGQINKAARDDDIDYTIIGLMVLEKFGADFTGEQVARTWAENLPYLHVYTAEMAAYRNYVMGLRPPDTATCMNPFREWIGAQIRGDIFGWMYPGNPKKAALLAYKDASLSHVKNGIYGEIMVAVMLALAPLISDIPELIMQTLEYIPPRSRLRKALLDALAFFKKGKPFDAALTGWMEKWGHYNPVHVIPNAGIVILSLLYSEKDFSRGISLAVQGGLDTDCNAATVGSVLGLMTGLQNIPAHYTTPFCNTIESIIPEYSNYQISALEKRICRLHEKIVTSNQKKDEIW